MRSRSALTSIIALLVVAAALVLILVFTKASDADARAIAILLGTALITLVSALHNSSKIDQVDRKVDEVAGNVNGRMSTLIEKIPDPPKEGTTTP